MRKRAPLLLVGVGVIAAFFVIRGMGSSGPEKPVASAPEATSTANLPRPRIPSGKAAGTSDGQTGTSSAAAEPNGKTVFKAKWGSGDDELGHERPQEGAPIGPMSMGIDGKGRIVILDSVNGRLVRRSADGKTENVTKIGLLDPQDMALGDDGTTAVLDRYADKKVAVYDETGALVGDYPLVGEGVDDVGSVTGVFVDGDNVYVEKEHGPLVQIGTTGGAPAEPRAEIPGRPSRDGLSFLKAGIIDQKEGRVYVVSIDRKTVENRFTRELKLGGFVRQIVLLDSDKYGTIYFAAEVEHGEGDASVMMSCLEPLKGVVVGSAELPANTLPEETFRDFAVEDDGGVLYALRTEEGVSYVKYDCE